MMYISAVWDGSAHNIIQVNMEGIAIGPKVWARTISGGFSMISVEVIDIGPIQWG